MSGLEIKANPVISYRLKNGILAIYLNYNFYFFEAESARWFLIIIKKQKKRFAEIPKSFINYLRKNKLII